VDVSVPSRNGRKRKKGIRIHRPVSLPTDDRRCRNGIPVTTPARTLADLRRVTTARQLRRAIREAEAQALRVGPETALDGTRSELEYRFLQLCRRHRLPRPETGTRIGAWIVDFLWRDQALIVETDGYRFHRGRVAFEDDRERDLGLRALGYTVVRLSHRQVAEEPRATVEMLRTILTGAPNSRPARRKRPAAA
jgi:very-short-patch-repair endonuclease